MRDQGSNNVTSQYSNPMMQAGMQMMGRESGGNNRGMQDGLAGMFGLDGAQLRQILEQLRQEASFRNASSPYRQQYMDNDGGPY